MSKHIRRAGACAPIPRDGRVPTRSQDHLLRAWHAALAMTYGQKAANHRCFRSFLNERLSIYAERGDSYILEIKRICGLIGTQLIAGSQVDPCLVGQLSPQRGKRHKLLQLVKLGRALPALHEKRTLAALKERYYQSVSEPFAFSDEWLKEKLISFGLGLYRERQPPILPDFSGSASCLGTKRRDGGRNSWLRERVVVKGPSEVESLSTLERVPYSRFPRQFGDAVPQGTDSEVVLVPELGAKARIVTKNDPVVVAFSHEARRRYFPVLTRNEYVTVSESLTDPDLLTIKLGGRKRGMFLYSADLSNATDRLSREAIDVLCACLDVDPACVYGTLVDGRPARRGTFMGLPVSWTILSLIHFRIAELVDPAYRFRIKGDDLVALWFPHQWDRYCTLMGAVGFEINYLKTAISRDMATFCENVYRWVRGRLIRLPIVPLRSFAKGQPLDYDQWRLYVHLGASWSRLHAVSVRCARLWIRVARKHGVDPYAPRCFGGLGMIPKRRNATVSRSTATVVQLAHNGQLNGQPLLLEADGPLLKRYMDASNRIRWSAQGSVDLTEPVNHVLATAFSRASIVDATNGALKMHHRESPYFVVRRLKRFVRLQTHAATAPRTTYAKAYEVSTRIKPVEIGGDLVTFYIRSMANAGRIKDLARAAKQPWWSSLDLVGREEPARA